jgi:hypothetical protein
MSLGLAFLSEAAWVAAGLANPVGVAILLGIMAAAATFASVRY